MGFAPAPQIDRKAVGHLLDEILKYTMSAERMLWRKPEFFVVGAYSYLREFLAAVVGFGVGPPALNFAAGVFASMEPSGDAAHEAAKNTATAFAHVPTPFSIVGTAALVLIVAVRVYASNERQKRRVLAESCQKEFRALTARAVHAMASHDVVGQLQQVLEDTHATYQRGHDSEAWPWEIVEPGIEIRLVPGRRDFMMRSLP